MAAFRPMWHAPSFRLAERGPQIRRRDVEGTSCRDRGGRVRGRGRSRDLLEAVLGGLVDLARYT
jgi:hypothetical protein